MKTETTPEPTPATSTDDVSGVAAAAPCSREEEWGDEKFAHYVQYITVGGRRIAAFGTRLCGSRWRGGPIKDLGSRGTKPLCPICDALFNANTKARDRSGSGTPPQNQPSKLP